jgi:cyanophycinase
MGTVRNALISVAVIPTILLAQAGSGAAALPRVGPPRGTVVVVGGGSMGPEIYKAFIDGAGGPDALILMVPNAGGADTYPQDRPSLRGWRTAGARNVHTLFTKDRNVANSDSFVAIIKKAGGVWFDGGRQYRLVDAYAGTKTEAAFHEVLARGGVVGGSSAGATILGEFLVRGAPSNNNLIMHYPGYEKAFSFLRNVGIDQHVVARERLADFADSLSPKFPNLLGISEDEGTAWVVRGDTGTIVGRSKAFVYGGGDPADQGKPFLTLFAGDVYDLGARRVIRRASDASPVPATLITSLFAKYEDAALGGATVLVAQDGKVLVDRSFGIPPQAKYMPTTTVPQFPLGALSAVFEAICAQIPEPPPQASATPAADNTASTALPLTPFQRCVSQRASQPVGLHKTSATAAGGVMSNVDELYRVALGLEVPRTYARNPTAAPGVEREPIDAAKGWEVDKYRGATRYRTFGSPGGKRSAFVRIPERHVTIIILTNDEAADARGMADQIADKLLGR